MLLTWIRCQKGFCLVESVSTVIKNNFSPLNQVTVTPKTRFAQLNKNFMNAIPLSLLPVTKTPFVYLNQVPLFPNSIFLTWIRCLVETDSTVAESNFALIEYVAKTHFAYLSEVPLLQKNVFCCTWVKC